MKKETAVLVLTTALICPVHALRSFHLGCSTTDQFLHGMTEVAQGFGDAQEIGKYTIAGAGMHVLWHQRDGKFQESTLRDQRWNAVICAAFPNGWELGIEADVKYASYFYDLAHQGNVDAILYTWSVYPSNDPGSKSWDEQWNNPQWTDAYASKGYHEAFFLAAREKYGKAHVRMMPIGQAMNKLHERIKNGRTNCFSSIFELYGDGVHLNEYGGYLGVMVHYAVLFGKNPQGAIRSAKWGYWQVETTIDEEFATLAQEIAWETVTELSEYTGVSNGQVAAGNPGTPGFSILHSSPIKSCRAKGVCYTTDGRVLKPSLNSMIPAAGIRIESAQSGATGVYEINGNGWRMVRRVR